MWKRDSAAPRRGPWIRKGVCTFLVPPRKVPKRRRAKGDTRRGHALRSMCRLRLRAAPSGWEPVPPGCPPPLSEGVMGRCGHRPLRVCSGNDSVPLNCLAYGQSSSPGDVPTLILPSFAPPGGILPIRGAKARGHSAECPCLRRRAFRAGTSSPRMPPSALRGGSFTRFPGYFPLHVIFRR